MANPTIKTCIKHAVKAQNQLDEQDTIIEKATSDKEGIVTKLRTDFFNASKRYGVDHETWQNDYKSACNELKEDGLFEKVPRSVIQLSSDIKQAMKLGLNPNDYDTATAYRTAKLDKDAELRKNDRVQPSGKNEDNEGGEVVATITHPAITDELMAAINELHKVIGKLPLELQVDAAVAISFTTDSLQAMIDDEVKKEKAA